MTAYGYCRISIDQEDSVSIEAQTEAIRRYHAHRFGDDAPLVIVVDRGVSGGVPLYDRPEGQQLLSMVGGDHLIVAKLDRAFRSVADGSAVIAWMSQEDIGVHSLDVQIDTSTIVGQAMLHLLIVFAELERKRIGERRRDAADYRRQNGHVMHHPQRPPIGWSIIGEGADSQYVPDQEDRARCLNLVRIADEEGLGIRRLERRVNDLRLLNRHGRRWSKASLTRAVWAARNGFPVRSQAVQTGPMVGKYRRRTHKIEPPTRRQ